MNIITGGVDGFSAVLYGERNQQDLEYFRNQLSNVAALQVIGSAGQSFIDAAHANYERFNSAQALQLARVANSQVKALFQPEIVKSIMDIVDFQTASLTMQRWIMANPVVRQMYQDQRCYGYTETYVDHDPGKKGEDHYDYRRVMSGVVVETDDGWYVNHYIDDLKDGDRELSDHNKVDILSTWKVVEMFMKDNDQDPTNPNSGYL